jgi:hypothetical protein
LLLLLLLQIEHCQWQPDAAGCQEEAGSALVPPFSLRVCRVYITPVSGRLPKLTPQSGSTRRLSQNHNNPHHSWNNCLLLVATDNTLTGWLRDTAGRTQRAQYAQTYNRVCFSLCDPKAVGTAEQQARAVRGKHFHGVCV